MNNIDEELKRLTRNASRRADSVSNAGFRSHILDELKSRNEKIIKASQLQYKQPFQFSTKFDTKTKERLIESYNRFFKDKRSTIKGLIDDMNRKAAKLNERFKGKEKTAQEWSKIFYAIEERKDISNIMDMFGSGRKMLLISELNPDKVEDTLDDLQDYIDKHPTDWDLFEFTNILLKDI